MKTLYKSLVYSNLWVGLAVASLAFITMANLSRVNVPFLAFITCSTVFAYNYMRLVQVNEYDQYDRLSFKFWIASHRVEVWLFTLTFGVLALHFFGEIYERKMIWLLILPGLVSLLYPLSFKNAFSGFTSLRSVPGLKMFLISATWSYVTVLVPVLLYGVFSTEDVIEFFLRTLFVLGLVIPFDIRDMEMDDPGMRTIPQVLGAERARQLAMFFLTLYQLWLFIRLLVFDASLPFTLALFIGVEIGYWLIRYAHRKHSEAYFSFWIEGVPVFCAVFLIVTRMVMHMI